MFPPTTCIHSPFPLLSVGDLGQDHCDLLLGLHFVEGLKYRLLEVVGRAVSFAEGWRLGRMARQRARLSFCDGLKNSQAFGQRSKQHLSELVFGREVELHTHGLDRYGRTLVIIFVNGIDANLEQGAHQPGLIGERFGKWIVLEIKVQTSQPGHSLLFST